MNFDTLKSTTLSGQISISGASITPSTAIGGPIPKFEQTHAVKDASGKRASVYVKVINAPNGLTYTSKVLPKEGSVTTQTQVSAEQWLTVPKADSILCTATASYGSLSAGVGLKETRSTATGDYVTLSGYDGKASATATLVSASQTATSGTANSIMINGSAKDISGTYIVNTPLSGMSGGKATFTGLSEISSAGTTPQVTQIEHLHGTFTSTATFKPTIGAAQTKTRASNYGTDYDLGIKAAKGSLLAGVRYYVNPTTSANKIQGAVNAAQSGDTINVAAGNYKENIQIEKSLTVNGAGSASTVVDGNKAGSVFKIGIINPNVNVYLSGMKIQNGVAPSGGGIYNNAKLTVTSSIISGNKATDTSATQGGGGIYNKGTAKIISDTISGNTASGDGGGICNELLGDLIVTSSTIKGNTASFFGGGIYSDLVANIKGCTISGNIAKSGGGIHNQGTMTTLSNTISGNGATSGGGIFNAGTATDTGSTISGNSAGSSNAYGYGGGIYNYKSSSVLTITGSKISGNKVVGPISTNKFANGGGIYNEGGATIKNSLISANSADIGGGISNYGTGAKLSISGSTISGNSAKYNGGGIHNMVGTTAVTSSTVSGNSAGTGGGIQNWASSKLSVSDSTITGNSATYSCGGGVYNSGTATVFGSTISGNSAKVSGGGFQNSGTATVSGSKITGNSAKSGGGISNDETATITSSTISGNSATNGFGGGICNNGNLFIGGTSQITNNQATIYGGGIYSYNSPVTLDGIKVAVKSNKAQSPYPLPAGAPWYQQYGVYMDLVPTTKNGFNPATQVTGNTHI